MKKDRREFLKHSAVFIGMASTFGLANRLFAEEIKLRRATESQQLRRAIPTEQTQQLLKLDRANLGKLGNNLFGSASERQKFMDSPTAYAEAFLGGKLDAANSRKLEDLKNMLASGVCCHGCGCGKPIENVIIEAR
jgi:hypothetical protein